LEAARQHFEAALESYSLGRYRRAIAELERARQLDPEGKDLVYNLALLHEKLGELTQALAYFRQYLEMETDADERARIAASIKRVQGALEAQGPPAAPSTIAVVRVTESEPVVRLEASPPGLADEWVWATGALAVAAAVAGAVLGARALALRPTRADATDSGRSVSDFRSDAHAAHRSAVAADIAFAVAIASGTTAGFLYFGRSSSSEQQLAWSAQVEPARPSTALEVGWRF
jgi:tetratricopeptide (TPR) repeat protein